jgi:hypothetical protein
MKELIEQQIEALKNVNLGLLSTKESNLIDAAITRLHGLNGTEQNTDYQIAACSPRALELIVDKSKVNTGITEQLGINGIYPFGQLLIGQSFVVSINTGKTRAGLESCQRNYAQRTGKSFRVVAHTKLGLFEVVRLS